jgi:hypothetical protein
LSVFNLDWGILGMGFVIPPIGMMAAPPFVKGGELLAMPPWAAHGFIGPFEGLT